MTPLALQAIALAAFGMVACVGLGVIIAELRGRGS